MRNIRMEKEIILYYGNPAGYASGGKAVVDLLFESEELKAFLSRQKDIGEVKWTDGVYDRLVNGQRDTQELTLLKNCRVWQLKPESDIRMRFISLADFCKTFGEPQMSDYQTVYDGEVETNDLEALYTKFNIAHPPGYAGHSLSMLMCWSCTMRTAAASSWNSAVRSHPSACCDRSRYAAELSRRALRLHAIDRVFLE